MAWSRWPPVLKSAVRFQPNIVFSIGNNASGSVAHTEATVRIPAIR